MVRLYNWCSWAFSNIMPIIKGTKCWLLWNAILKIDDEKKQWTKQKQDNKESSRLFKHSFFLRWKKKHNNNNSMALNREIYFKWHTRIILIIVNLMRLLLLLGTFFLSCDKIKTKKKITNNWNVLNSIFIHYFSAATVDCYQYWYIWEGTFSLILIICVLVAFFVVFPFS